MVLQPLFHEDARLLRIMCKDHVHLSLFTPDMIEKATAEGTAYATLARKWRRPLCAVFVLQRRRRYRCVPTPRLSPLRQPARKRNPCSRSHVAPTRKAPTLITIWPCRQAT